MNKKSKILYGVSVLSIVAIAAITLSIRSKNPLNSPASDKPYSPPQAILDKYKPILETQPENTLIAKEAIQLLQSQIKVGGPFRYAFYKAAEIFDGTPGAYAAARFFALGLLMVDTEDYNYLMRWTMKDIKANSKSLMDQLDQDPKVFALNTYFHESAINLAHQLDVPVERKLNFYGHTIAKPIQLKENGDLSDASLPIEIALGMMKDSGANSSEIAPHIDRALKNYDTNTPEHTAFKTRVLAYFPDLSYLF